MTKLEKLKKLRDLSEDLSTTPAERELAYKRYIEFKSKYSLNDEDVEEKIFNIKTNTEFELTLLDNILYTFGIKEVYNFKYNSKLKRGFKTTKIIFEGVKDDFEYHRDKLKATLMGVTYRYIHTQINPPEIDDSDSSNFDQELDPTFKKAYLGNAWLARENYKNRLKIEER